MDYQAIITLAIAIAALTLKPGPGMMLVISHTVYRGMLGCFAVLLGAQLVNLVFLGLVFVGFSAFDFDLVFLSILIKALASVYLIWMGIEGIKKTDESFQIEDKLNGRGFWDSMTSSMMLTASNPLVIVFYAGILPTLLNVSTMGISDITTIVLVIVLVEAGLAAAYCLPFALFRYKLSPPILQKMQIVSSVIIIMIGLYIGYSALPAEDLKSVF